MPSGALGMISKISSKFFHEVMPVALASVIGTMLVNHYSRQPISPPVVVQATPPASAEAMFQTLRDEQVLIADYLRRDADAKRDADVARDRGPSAVEDRLNKARPVSAEKAAPRPPVKPPEKMIAARDSAPLELAPAVVAPPARAEPGEAPAAKHAGVVDTVRDWIVNVSEAPARALAPRLFDDPPTPPQPVPAGVALPAPAEPGEAPAARHAGVVDTVRDWIVNVSEAPARALAPRLFGDPPTPPMPVPVSGPQLAHEN